MSEQEMKQMLNAILEAVQMNAAETKALNVRVGNLEQAVGALKQDVADIKTRVTWIEANMVTKAEFADYVTYADHTFVKKADLSIFATKADLLAMEGRLLQKWYAHEQDIQHLKQHLR